MPLRLSIAALVPAARSPLDATNDSRFPDELRDRGAEAVETLTLTPPGGTDAATEAVNQAALMELYALAARDAWHESSLELRRGLFVQDLWLDPVAAYAAIEGASPLAH